MTPTEIENYYTKMLKQTVKSFDALLKHYGCSGASEQVGLTSFKGSFDHIKDGWLRTVSVTTQHETATITFNLKHSGRHGENFTSHELIYYCATQHCVAPEFFKSPKETVTSVTEYFKQLAHVKQSVLSNVHTVMNFDSRYDRLLAHVMKLLGSSTIYHNSIEVSSWSNLDCMAWVSEAKALIFSNPQEDVTKYELLKEKLFQLFDNSESFHGAIEIDKMGDFDGKDWTSEVRAIIGYKGLTT